MRKSKIISKFSSALIIAALLFSNSAAAGILWAGGEDIDFPLGATLMGDAPFKARSGYARYNLYSTSAGGIFRSKPFEGGAVTSAWLTAQVWIHNTTYSGYKLIGLGKTATNNSLWVGIAAAGGGTRVALYKYDGAWTEIAAETGNSFSAGGNNKVDMQIINYGAAGTVNIYIASRANPVLTYTGDIRAGASTDLDDVRWMGVANTDWLSFSEFIVADTDTRLMSLVTQAPNAAGTTNQWTGAYTAVDETLNADGDVVTTATSGQNFQCNLSDLPVGNFAVHAVRVASRVSSTGAGIAGVTVGLYTNATVSVPAATTLTTSWITIEKLYQNNPVTAVPFTSTEANNLQLNLQSAP